MKSVRYTLGAFLLSIFLASAGFAGTAGSVASVAADSSILPSTTVDTSREFGEKISEKRKTYLESHMNTMRSLINTAAMMHASGEADVCEIGSFVVGLTDSIPMYVVSMPEYLSVEEYDRLSKSEQLQLRQSDKPSVILFPHEVNELSVLVAQTRKLIDASLQDLEDPSNGCFNDGQMVAAKPSKKECCKLRSNRPIECIEVEYRARCKAAGADNESCTSNSTLCPANAGASGLIPLDQ